MCDSRINTTLPPKSGSVVFIDLDGVLVFRSKVEDIAYMNSMRPDIGLTPHSNIKYLTPEMLEPRPHIAGKEVESPSGMNHFFVYLRPGALEFLQRINERFGRKNTVIFTASMTHYAIAHCMRLGIMKYVSVVLGRDEYIEGYGGGGLSRPQFMRPESRKINGETFDGVVKQMSVARKYLGIEDTVRCYMIDDNPSWIEPTINDVIIPVRPFSPTYRVLRVAIIEGNQEPIYFDEFADDIDLDVMFDSLPEDNTLKDIADAILRDESELLRGGGSGRGGTGGTGGGRGDDGSSGSFRFV